MTADYSRPVDLAHEPLMNMTLLRVGDAAISGTAGSITSHSTATPR